VIEREIDVWIEQGVWWNLDLETLKGFRKVVRFWRKLSTDVHVTSGREGTTHLPHSYHHYGRAFDLRIPTWFNEEIRHKLCQELGPQWVILNESTHLHFQCNWVD